jgi:hypothetical protein
MVDKAFRASLACADSICPLQQAVLTATSTPRRRVTILLPLKE